MYNCEVWPKSLIRFVDERVEVKNNSTSRFVGFSKLLELFLIPPFFCYFIRWFLAVQERIWNCFKMALVSINFKFVILEYGFFLINISSCIFYRKVFCNFLQNTYWYAIHSPFPPRKGCFYLHYKGFCNKLAFHNSLLLNSDWLLVSIWNA